MKACCYYLPTYLPPQYPPCCSGICGEQRKRWPLQALAQNPSASSSSTEPQLVNMEETGAVPWGTSLIPTVLLHESGHWRCIRDHSDPPAATMGGHVRSRDGRDPRNGVARRSLAVEWAMEGEEAHQSALMVVLRLGVVLGRTRCTY